MSLIRAAKAKMPTSIVIPTQTSTLTNGDSREDFSGGVLNEKAINLPKPAYPPIASRQRHRARWWFRYWSTKGATWLRPALYRDIHYYKQLQ